MPTTNHPTAEKALRRWLAVFIGATVVLGALLRWDLATTWLTRAGLDFAHVRHAHSHVGFYGFLTLAWWLVAMRDTGISRAFAHAHAVVVTLATASFAMMGYNALTIALSTIVAGFWLVSAWRARRAPGWFALVPWGIVVGMLLVVPIAITARRDLLLSRQLAHLFVAALLLLSFVPAALGALRVPLVPRPAWAATVLIGAVQLIFPALVPFSLGWMTSLAGIALARALWLVRGRLPGLVVAAWLGLAGGMVAMGLVPWLQTEAMRITALHFAMLVPVGLTTLHVLAPERATIRRPSLAVALGGALLMLGAMAMMGLATFDWLPTVAAIGGTATAIGVLGLVRV